MNRQERRKIKRNDLSNSNNKVIQMDLKTKKMSEFKNKSAKISFYYTFILSVILAFIFLSIKIKNQ